MTAPDNPYNRVLQFLQGILLGITTESPHWATVANVRFNNTCSLRYSLGLITWHISKAQWLVNVGKKLLFCAVISSRLNLENKELASHSVGRRSRHDNSNNSLYPLNKLSKAKPFFLLQTFLPLIMESKAVALQSNVILNRFCGKKRI